MKKLLSFFSFVLLLCTVTLAQGLPVFSGRDLNGSVFTTGSLISDGRPDIIIVWDTKCGTCQVELEEIQKVSKKWQDETGVVITAISVDKPQTLAQVQPIIRAKGWTNAVYLDLKQDFLRAMGDPNLPLPCTVIFDKQGKIVAQYDSYTAGDENKWFEVIKQLAQ